MTLLLRYLLGLFGIGGQESESGGEPPVDPPGGGGGVTVTTDGPLPEVLPQEVVEAVARCACCPGESGSGSGSGSGNALCCDCVNHPDSVNITLTVSCMGSITREVFAVPVVGDVVTCARCPPGKTRKSYNRVELATPGLDFFGCTSCINGTSISVIGVSESDVFNGGIYCYSCVDGDCDENIDGAHVWVLEASWLKYVAGEIKSVTIRSLLNLVSCNPLVFETVNATVQCGETPPAEDRCDTPLLAETVCTNCVGASVEVEISE